MVVMAMDQQTGQEIGLRHLIVRQQARPIVRQRARPIVRQQGRPIAPLPGPRHQHVHRRQTILRLQWDQVAPGVVVEVEVIAEVVEREAEEAEVEVEDDN